jgi:hypothetical protein
MTPDERKTLIEQYAEGFNEVLRSLQGLAPEQMLSHPIEGKWSAREIVQHLADSEMISATRLRRLLFEENPEIIGYDQDGYATRFAYNERDAQPALEAIRAARATTMQIIERMTEEDWQRAGTHNEHGRYSVEDWLRIYAAHAHNHAAQIRRLREALA